LTEKIERIELLNTVMKSLQLFIHVVVLVELDQDGTYRFSWL